VQLDYDRQGHMLYWLQSLSGDSEDDENCTIYSMPYGGGNKIEFFGQDTGIVGAPSAIAFDWLGRNLYMGNRAASNIEMVRVEGKVRYRTIVLANDGNKMSVAKPKGICLDPTEGSVSNC
jgi:low density lipoprotein-related protein 2